MKLTQTLIAAAIAIVPMTAMAAGTVDVFYGYTSEKFEGGGGSDKADGHGYGVRGQAALNDCISLTGLYQTGSLEDNATKDKFDLDEVRIGVMGHHKLNDDIMLLAGAERVQLTGQPRGTGDGFGARGYVVKTGATTKVGDVSLSATVGYIALGRGVDGYEAEASAAIPLADKISGFVDYRYTRTKDDGDTDTGNLGRVGVRYAL